MPPCLDERALDVQPWVSVLDESRAPLGKKGGWRRVYEQWREAGGLPEVVGDPVHLWQEFLRLRRLPPGWDVGAATDSGVTAAWLLDWGSATTMHRDGGVTDTAIPLAIFGGETVRAIRLAHEGSIQWHATSPQALTGILATGRVLATSESWLPVHAPLAAWWPTLGWAEWGSYWVGVFLDGSLWAVTVEAVTENHEGNLGLKARVG